ncbi:ArsA family ATPase [Streptomyces sp. MUM 178J]|uniref:ArsA family ATPase n=1 Tax=Streptomyces sp. MUM 178J TaxID=2791991 RepID=UPI001F040B85|nr:ArsA-related P-loop ATPase [Streptomyces sp. MUM 178J]WRQ79030.1 ArsA-related P-loop ATPase [Streptomyces sp. MUM 178J]
MRTVLVTGLGGAGRTVVAAATALAAARGGERTLFLSADPGEVLGAPVRGGVETPEPVAESLWAARIEPAADFRAEFLSLQERCGAALDLLGAARLEEEELTELPGSEEFALLRALAHAARGDWDRIVLDLPPLRRAIALLALPEQLRRYLRRLLPRERQAARALRPVLAQLAGVPMPAQRLYETAERWDAELAAVQAVVDHPATAVRLVAEPGPAAADALRSARLGLALQGPAPDMVVANRVLPAETPDAWLAGLIAQQHKHLAELRTEYGTVCELPHLGRDPRGLDDLTLLAPSDDALLAPGPGWTVEDRRSEDGGADGGFIVWRLPLPGAVKEELTLVRRGGELLVTAGPFRRIAPLPAALRRCTVAGAGLVDGELTVRFAPDPGLWPLGR